MTKLVDRKFEEHEKAIIVLSQPKVSNYNESSFLTVELSKNRVLTFEKLLIEKDAIINFLLKKNKENHESSLTEIDSTKIKQLISEQLQQPLEKKNECPIKIKKRNIILTGDSVLNNISEKCLRWNEHYLRAYFETLMTHCKVNDFFYKRRFFVRQTLLIKYVNL